MTAVNLSRRELAFLVPLLGLEGARADEQTALMSKVYHPDQSTDLGGKPKKGGRILFGTEHSGFQLEMHETVLGPGVEAHPPHQHVHEEIIIVMEGAVEIFIEGKTEMAEAGSVIYYGSNQLHRSKNVGRVPTRYYVLELRGRAQS